MNPEVLIEEVTEAPVEEVTEASAESTEYQALVVERLDTLVSIQQHNYAMGLFTIASVSAVFVCVLFWKFLRNCF